jgi:hypothetical protein
MLENIADMAGQGRWERIPIPFITEVWHDGLENSNRGFYDVFVTSSVYDADRDTWLSIKQREIALEELVVR